MIKVLSFLSNENCFVGHRFEHHCHKIQEVFGHFWLLAPDLGPITLMEVFSSSFHWKLG